MLSDMFLNLRHLIENEMRFQNVLIIKQVLRSNVKRFLRLLLTFSKNNSSCKIKFRKHSSWSEWKRMPRKGRRGAVHGLRFPARLISHYTASFLSFPAPISRSSGHWRWYSAGEKGRPSNSCSKEHCPLKCELKSTSGGYLLCRRRRLQQHWARLAERSWLTVRYKSPIKVY